MYTIEQKKRTTIFRLIAAIKTGRAKKAASPAAVKSKAKTASVNKRGSLTISRGFAEKMGFAEGDRFQIKKTKAGISLKKL